MRNRPIIETILTLPLAGQQSCRARTAQQSPAPVTQAPPRMLSAPITIPKPPPVKPQEKTKGRRGKCAAHRHSGRGGARAGLQRRQLGASDHAERERCGYGRCGLYPWRARQAAQRLAGDDPAHRCCRACTEAPDSEFTVNTGADQHPAPKSSAASFRGRAAAPSCRTRPACMSRPACATPRATSDERLDSPRYKSAHERGDIGRLRGGAPDRAPVPPLPPTTAPIAGWPGPAAVAAVVKADAYGLGAARVAPALADAGCDSFFVARLEEGIALRKLAAAGAHLCAGWRAGRMRCRR